MLVQKFGEYVLRGRKEAALMAFIWTLVPLMGWLGVAIMALVTLRKGAFEGLLVLLCTVIPSITFALLGYDNSILYGIFCGSVVTWILAILLRETQSWVMLLQVGTSIAIIAVVGIHIFVPDIQQFWIKLITRYYNETEKDLALQLTADDLKSIIAIMAKFATGVQAVVLLFIATFNLMIARWWQSMLYNPGGLSKELCQIRLNLFASVALLIILLAMPAGFSVAWDLLPLILLLFFCAGLSLIHALTRKAKIMWAWLLAYYGLLILFFPYVGVFTVTLAIADSLVDIRTRVRDQQA